MGSVRIDRGLEEKIQKVAARKGITRSELFRQALETYCDQELTSYTSGSRLSSIPTGSVSAVVQTAVRVTNGSSEFYVPEAARSRASNER